MTDNTIIYAVMYNYSGKNYSLIKTMTNITKAYEYICLQESQNYYEEEPTFTILNVQSQTDICDYTNKRFAICYIVDGDYLSLNVEHDNISQYIIAPIQLE
jgi:hypothetical protein